MQKHFYSPCVSDEMKYFLFILFLFIVFIHTFIHSCTPRCNLYSWAKVGLNTNGLNAMVLTENQELYNLIKYLSMRLPADTLCMLASDSFAFTNMPRRIAFSYRGAQLHWHRAKGMSIVNSQMCFMIWLAQPYASGPLTSVCHGSVVRKLLVLGVGVYHRDWTSSVSTGPLIYWFYGPVRLTLPNILNIQPISIQRQVLYDIYLFIYIYIFRNFMNK